MPDKSERETLIEQVLEAYRRQLEAELPHTDLTLDQIEAVAGRIGEQVSQDVQRLARKRGKKPAP